MKKLLVIGLVVSVVSIFFNVWVNTALLGQIEERKSRRAFLSSRNLLLSAEFSDAEHFRFFSDFYVLNAQKRQPALMTASDSAEFGSILRRRDEFLIKGANYAYNATILNPLTDYDSAKVKVIQGFIVAHTRNMSPESLGWLTREEVQSLRQLYNQYYQEHEALVKTNVEETRRLEEELVGLNLKLQWGKSIAVFFQILGLILVFLKDAGAKDAEPDA